MAGGARAGAGAGRGARETEAQERVIKMSWNEPEGQEEVSGERGPSCTLSQQCVQHLLTDSRHWRQAGSILVQLNGGHTRRVTRREVEAVSSLSLTDAANTLGVDPAVVAQLRNFFYAIRKRRGRTVAFKTTLRQPTRATENQTPRTEKQYATGLCSKTTVQCDIPLQNSRNPTQRPTGVPDATMMGRIAQS